MSAEHDRGRPGRALRAVGRYRGLVALAVVLLLGAVVSPRNLKTGQSVFLTATNQSNVLFEYAEYGLLAVGMTLVILTAGIDLSVGSVLGFVATLFSYLLIARGWALPSAIAGGLLGGTACGLVSGLLVSHLRLQPFVATLAMMVAARGAAKMVSGGIKIAHGARPWYVVQDAPPPIFEWMTMPAAGGWLRPVTVTFFVTILLMALVMPPTAGPSIGRPPVTPSAATRRPRGCRGCTSPGQSSWPTSCAALPRPWPAYATPATWATAILRRGSPTSWMPSRRWSSAAPV